MSLLNRRYFTLISAAIVASFAGSAAAQNYPEKPITLIIPYAAGGITDVVHRVIAEAASVSLGQPIIIENLTGAGGKIGARAYMAAAPDGYTIGVLNSTIGVNTPFMEADFSADAGKDYTPITRTLDVSMVLTTGSSTGYKTAAELIEYAKANPNKVTLGSSGTGTTGHLTIELLKSLTGIQATHVPYRGEAPLITDLIGGQIQGAVIAYPKQLADAGQLLPLGVAAEVRFSNVPDLATLEEQGMDIIASAWQGIVGPAKLPQDIIDKLNVAFGAALNDPAVAQKLTDFQITLTHSSPQEFADYIAADLARWEPVFEAAGLLAKK